MIEKLPEISRSQIYVCVSKYEIFMFNFIFSIAWKCVLLDRVQSMCTGFSPAHCSVWTLRKLQLKILILFKKAVGLKVFFGVG